MERLGYDLWTRIFLCLDLENLLRVDCAWKRWRCVTRDDLFDQRWQQLHRRENATILLNAYNKPRYKTTAIAHRHWSPASKTVAPLPAWLQIPCLPRGTTEIVASSNGLLAIRQLSLGIALEILVGNPATGQWVRVPCLNYSSRSYQLMADPATGEFKLDAGISLRYDSRTREWDLRDEADDLELPEKMVVSKRQRVRCHVSWEHRGLKYMAVTDVDDQQKKVNCIVWEMTGDLEYARKLVQMEEYGPRLECGAEFGLVCVYGPVSDPYTPPVVYDLNADEWNTIGKEDEGEGEGEGQEEQGQQEREENVEEEEGRGGSEEELDYRVAVAYHPSLLTPAGVKIKDANK